MLKKKIASVLIVSSLIVTCGTKSSADETKENPYEPFRIRCTCYTADADAVTKSGQKVREGIIAGKEEWLGKDASLYAINQDGSLGEFIGIFEFLDTGSAQSLKDGKSVDVFRNSMDAMNGLIHMVIMFISK